MLTRQKLFKCCKVMFRARIRVSVGLYLLFTGNLCGTAEACDLPYAFHLFIYLSNKGQFDLIQVACRRRTVGHGPWWRFAVVLAARTSSSLARSKSWHRWRTRASKSTGWMETIFSWRRESTSTRRSIPSHMCRRWVLQHHASDSDVISFHIYGSWFPPPSCSS